MGRGEIACDEQFLLFPQCFLLNQILVSQFIHIYDIIFLFAAELEEPRIGISGKGLMISLFFPFTPFPNKPWFLRDSSTSLLKTLREKEKFLVTSNFSFSDSVLFPFAEPSVIFIKFKIVLCKPFQFGRV